MSTTEQAGRPPGARGDALHAELLDGLISARPLPRWLDANVALDAGRAGTWTLAVRSGYPTLAPGAPRAADTRITTDAQTLRALAAGQRSGIEAFLDGQLQVRGNLALSLRVAGMWPRSTTPARIPTAGDVRAHGLRTFYIEAGEGPPVVLLHGLGATNASFLPTLQALSKDHRVIAPDLPGFGDSDKPLRPLHAAFYARWLVGFLDALGLQRPHLVGNSMGGRIAVEAGLRHPERVDRLVLLAPSPAFLRRREYVRVVRLLRPELALVPLALPRSTVQQGIRSMFARPSRLERAWYDAATDEFVRVFSTARGRVCFFSAARQIYLEEAHSKPGRFWGRLPALQRPALFVWGRRDRLVPPGFAAHVEKALPAARSVVLDDCGHVPQFEQPDATHELAREFLTAA